VSVLNRPAGAERPSTPAQAWAALRAGNARFAAGASSSADTGPDRRAELAAGQRPFALVFGCSDSRVAAELVFDQGLGDLFVVRTAGHVIDSGVLGSVEFGIGVLGIPLVVVLGHEDCGAVGATVQALDDGVMPGGYVRDVVERVMPSVLTARRAGVTSVEGILAEHVHHTARLLAERSVVVADAVASGRCAVVGATYSLREGQVRLDDVVGEAGVDLA